MSITTNFDKDVFVMRYPDGSEYWFFKRKLHRENAPAIIYGNGTKEWHCKGKIHREDGPAVECIGGYQEYWFNNKKYSFEDWQQMVKLKAFL